MSRKTLEAIDAGDKAIWNAIVYVTEDRIHVRVGQKKKAERLHKLIKTLESKK